MTVVFLFWQVVELLVDNVSKMFHELMMSTKSFVKSQVTLSLSDNMLPSKVSIYIYISFKYFLPKLTFPGLFP